MKADLKLTVSHRSAAWAMFAACAARTFLALAVEMPATHNGAWLSALLGGLLALPLVLCVDRMGGMASTDAPLRLILLLGTVIDTAACFGAITRSAGYLALNRVPTAALILPVILAALWCVFRGGDAVGRGAMAWSRLFPALLLIVVLLQVKRYRPGWLAPVLGNGWRSVALGGIRAAGCAVPAASVLLVCEPREDGREAPLLLICAALVTAVLVALRLMLTPTTTDPGGWLNRLDTLLTNGRAPLYLQLPMITLWYAGLLHALACDCFTSAALFQRLVPRLDGRVCALVTVCASCVAASLMKDGMAASIYPWLYIVAALSAALTTMKAVRKEADACAG